MGDVEVGSTGGSEQPFHNLALPAAPSFRPLMQGYRG